MSSQSLPLATHFLPDWTCSITPRQCNQLRAKCPTIWTYEGHFSFEPTQVPRIPNLRSVIVLSGMCPQRSIFTHGFSLQPMILSGDGGNIKKQGIGSMPWKEIRNCGTYVSSSSSDFYEVDVTKPLRPIRCNLQPCEPKPTFLLM